MMSDKSLKIKNNSSISKIDEKSKYNPGNCQIISFCVLDQEDQNWPSLGKKTRWLHQQYKPQTSAM